MKKILSKTFLFLIVFFTIERFCHRQTHGFRLHKIQSNHEYNPFWEIHQNSLPHEALSQPYHFLESGGECYAFSSKDEKYVLKFFKHHHMREKKWHDSLPFLKTKDKRKKRLETLFSSCKIAQDRFQNETGLIYLHLNQTENLNIQLKIFDAIGVLHHLDLDQITFALQKKASLAYPTLTHLIEAGELEAAKTRLSSLIQLMIARSKAGIADHDPRKRNFGFVGDQAIEIDLGSFSINEELKTSKETRRALYRETIKLRRWVKKYHPELTDFLKTTLEEHFVESPVLQKS